MITTVKIEVEIEYKDDDALETTVDALDTACENVTPAKGAKILTVRVV